MSKEKLTPYFDYFDEYTADSWSYSSFIRYALGKRLLPSDPIRVYNYKYKKCLDFIEQNYNPLKRSKAFSLKRSFKLGSQPGQYYTECPRATLGFLDVLLLLCFIKQNIDTIQGALAPPWLDKKMEEKWLANLNELAKNEEIAEREYNASLNKDVRKEKMIYSSYLLESRKSKHQIDREEDVTSTKRRKDLTNVSLEDDGRSNMINVAYPGKSMDDRSMLESADSKMNQVNNNLRSSSSAPSFKFNNEEDIEPEYYDAREKTIIVYSWKDAIDKIDFRNTSKKDWIFESYNLSNEFRNFQRLTIQQVKEKPYLCYKKDIQKILCLSNIMLIERIKPAYLSCDLASWNTIRRRKTSSYLPSVVINVVLEYSLLLNSFTPLEEMEDRWCKNFSMVTELDKIDRVNFCKCQIILRNFFLLGFINKNNEDDFVHNTLHDMINEIFRDPMLELVWANSESSASKSRRLGNKENITVKGNEPDFKISTNTKDEILFGEVKPRDPSSILVKKDLVRLAEFQAGTLDELIKKYGNKVGIISFGIWICDEHIRIYEMDLNYDGIYRMILVADVCVPIEREKIVGLVPVLEAFYNIKHRISEALTVITSSTPLSSLSCSSYGRASIPSPKPVKITIVGLQQN
ncbi:1747_t:CDS:10 [Acaulospora morrowiae]|uniref:1747_t:CDS:1 n=1 Tax=Acaulospora morrowiae TaxID=94023 RepID=A0A9N8VR07_9GLOM|nr:1747_t:CDS:10 [Acaulospora morrowiae]